MCGQKQEMNPVKLEIHTIDGLTGHSGRKQLMDFVTKCDPKPKKIIINHGESSRSLDLASSLHKANRLETVVPRNLDALRLR
jgi:predicted metal-dependent RNase